MPRSPARSELPRKKRVARVRSPAHHALMTTTFQVSALPSDDAERLRSATFDDFGNALEAAVQSGPCRHCLRYALPGERLVLAAYSPFAVQNPYRESGPVFIHADGCARYAGPGLPPDFAMRPVALRAYDAAQTIVHGEVVVDGTTERRVAGLLSDPAVAFVHVRSLTHGCYLFRIDRT